MHDHASASDAVGLMALLPPDFASASLYLALFVTGLLAGATHCTAMCGPFVLVRAARAGAGLPVEALGPWLRLRAGALPAYHAGRALTYGAFGAVAGAFGGGFAAVIGLAWVRYVAIGFAIALLLAPIVGRFSAVVSAAAPPQWWQEAVARIAGGAARAPGMLGDMALGAALGFLPCGMIYTALAASAGSGSAGAGALSMVAFVAGTWLPLAVLGALGATAGRRLRVLLRRWAVPLAVLNLLALGAWFTHA
ncbi:sulfite exporter TauE/SafE family protein [Vineibacter terrae]|uniref:urease accessory protein UreH domain-containing protein n=1 Tax=Vineibacter terrae TaxID=2586908 RepID=UPI002E3496FF|nr:sulfite exporter TauE/SafE family protein [Vineibacter terrae]HEX2886464.1 sulfite exporter TauE/SafE family protein [Vineibacter terrae]